MKKKIASFCFKSLILALAFSWIILGQSAYASVMDSSASAETPAATDMRVIGIKTADSEYVYFVNNSGVDIKEIYLKRFDTEEWGKNLIPPEARVQDKEQVQIYYETNTEEAQTDNVADFKFVIMDNSVHVFRDINIADIKEENFSVVNKENAMKFTYTSESEQMDKELTEVTGSDISDIGTSSNDNNENDPEEYSSDYNDTDDSDSSAVYDDIESEYDPDNFDTHDMDAPEGSSADDSAENMVEEPSYDDLLSNYQPELYYGEFYPEKTYKNSDEYYQDAKDFGYE